MSSTAAPAERTHAAERPARLEQSLDDHEHPFYTIGQAADLLEVEPGVLRRLEDSAAIASSRSSGRHRRYSRSQLEHARRILDLVDEGMSAAGARRVMDLENENAALRARLDRPGPPAGSRRS